MSNKLHPNTKDLTGQKFGKLTVLNFEEYRKVSKGSEGYKNLSYWNCLCDCGKKKTVSGHSLNVGRSKSCGCHNRKPKGEAGFNRLFRNYRYNAKKRDLKFTLTKSQFKKLTKQNCHYCKLPPSNIVINSNGNTTKEGVENSAYTYNGIDRKDNTKSYNIKNCLPCCTICNRAKKDLSYEEFMDYINRIKNVKNS